MASKHKEQVAEDLKEVFNLGLSKDNIKTAFKRLKLFSDKWSGHYKHMEKISFNPMNELYFTYTNWIERLNKEFRCTFKIRNSMPNFESALTLISKVAMDKEDAYFKYPIYNFKFEKKFNELV